MSGERGVDALPSVPICGERGVSLIEQLGGSRSLFAFPGAYSAESKYISCFNCWYIGFDGDITYNTIITSATNLSVANSVLFAGRLDTLMQVYSKEVHLKVVLLFTKLPAYCY